MAPDSINKMDINYCNYSIFGRSKQNRSWFRVFRIMFIDQQKNESEHNYVDYHKINQSLTSKWDHIKRKDPQKSRNLPIII